MFATQTSAVVSTVRIERADAIECAICLFSNGIASKAIKDNSKDASQSLRGYMFQRLQAGEGRRELESFKDACYAAAESSGYLVNRKSNTVGSLVSTACVLSERADGLLLVRSASSLSEAVRMAKQIDKSIEEQAALVKAAEAEAASLIAADAAAQAEADAQRDRDDAAELARLEAIEDGSYAVALAQQIRDLIETYRSVGGEESFA